MNLLENRAVRAVAIVVILAGLLGYHFYFRVPELKSQRYEGTVQKTSVEKEHLTGGKHSGGDTQRTYHLVIDTASGGTRQVEVPHAVWNRAEEGDPVKKIPGERYPKVMTEEAVDKREAVEDVDLFGQNK